MTCTQYSLEAFASVTDDLLHLKGEYTSHGSYCHHAAIAASRPPCQAHGQELSRPGPGSQVTACPRGAVWRAPRRTHRGSWGLGHRCRGHPPRHRSRAPPSNPPRICKGHGPGARSPPVEAQRRCSAIHPYCAHTLPSKYMKAGCQHTAACQGARQQAQRSRRLQGRYACIKRLRKNHRCCCSVTGAGSEADLSEPARLPRHPGRLCCCRLLALLGLQPLLFLVCLYRTDMHIVSGLAKTSSFTVAGVCTDALKQDHKLSSC